MPGRFRNFLKSAIKEIGLNRTFPDSKKAAKIAEQSLKFRKVGDTVSYKYQDKDGRIIVRTYKKIDKLNVREII